MKRIRFLFLVALTVLGAASAARAAAASIQAILVTASNEKGPADPRLRPYEAVLQRNVPESSFHFVADQAAALPARGGATLSLGGADRVIIEREGDTSFKVRWMHQGRQVVGATMTPVPGTPFAYLHRPAQGAPRLVILIVN